MPLINYNPDAPEPQKPRKGIITLEKIQESLSHAAYSEYFKEFVIGVWRDDHEKPAGDPWTDMMLIPSISAVNDEGERVPYEVCMVKYADNGMVGFCMNAEKGLARAMPHDECVRLWKMMLKEVKKNPKILFPGSSDVQS